MLNLLRSVLEACSILAGQSKPPQLTSNQASPSNQATTALCKLLNQRIDGFWEIARRDGWLDKLDLDRGTYQDDEKQSKFATARLALEALVILSHLETANAGQREPVTQELPPLYGLKDNKTITILCGLVARWGIGLLVPKGILPNDMQDKVEKIVEVSSDEIDGEENEEELLREMVGKIVEILVLPTQAASGGARQLQTLVLPGLMLHTLAALLYLSNSAASEDTDLKPKEALEKLLNLTNPSTSLATLLALLASQRNNGPHRIQQPWLAPMLSSLLSMQLLRKGGILGLLNVLLGRSESELQIAQLEQIAKVLSTPPSGMDADAYFSIILPRIISLIQPPVSGQPPPASYFRALCFCISRLIPASPQAVTKYVLPHFSLSSSSSSAQPDIEGQLELLSTLVAHMDPSPTNYAFILHTQLITKLFSAWFFILDTKGDPILRESIENLLMTWGRSLSIDEVSNGLQEVVEHAEEYKWMRTESGGIAPRSYKEASNATFADKASPSTSKFLLDDDEELQRREELDADENNPTLIRPNPDYIVQYLSTLARPGLSSNLLLLWLDEMRLLQQRAKLSSSSSTLLSLGDSAFSIQKKIVLRLQLILGIIDKFGPEEIVKEPKKMLAFVDLALESNNDNLAAKEGEYLSEKRSGKQRASRGGGGLSMKDLKIVEVASDSEESERDEEDPDDLPEILGLAKGEELVITGLTLLLAILEGNDTLDFGTTPLLHNISLKLDALIENASSTAAELARNAKIVLMSRQMASDSATFPSQNGKHDDMYSSSRRAYQEALKLLQDPLLPIRAQGLSLLRSLVSSKSAFLCTDSALLPGILDIFIQSIQDEDSFIYLNAVSGLAALASGYGRNVVKKLVKIYVSQGKEVGEGEKGRRELDKRLRIAETINQVVQQRRDALAVYVDSLLLSLLHVMRSADLPVALRSSALTILATCAESAPLALLSEINTLTEACLDLLSIESSSKNVFQPILIEERNKIEESLDPLECASTHPSLRRGTILFLTLLVRAMQEKGDMKVVQPRTARRLEVVVGYVRDTDPDALVRHNAGVLLDEL